MYMGAPLSSDPRMAMQPGIQPIGATGYPSVSPYGSSNMPTMPPAPNGLPLGPAPGSSLSLGQTQPLGPSPLGHSGLGPSGLGPSGLGPSNLGPSGHSLYGTPQGRSLTLGPTPQGLSSVGQLSGPALKPTPTPPSSLYGPGQSFSALHAANGQPVYRGVPGQTVSGISPYPGAPSPVTSQAGYPVGMLHQPAVPHPPGGLTNGSLPPAAGLLGSQPNGVSTLHPIPNPTTAARNGSQAQAGLLGQPVRHVSSSPHVPSTGPSSFYPAPNNHAYASAPISSYNPYSPYAPQSATSPLYPTGPPSLNGAISPLGYPPSSLSQPSYGGSLPMQGPGGSLPPGPQGIPGYPSTMSHLPY